MGAKFNDGAVAEKRMTAPGPGSYSQ